MTVIRIKGLKRYRVRGRWYAYHRKSGTRLKSEFGTAEFIAELVSLERKSARRCQARLESYLRPTEDRPSGDGDSLL